MHSEPTQNQNDRPGIASPWPTPTQPTSTWPT